MEEQQLAGLRRPRVVAQHSHSSSSVCDLIRSRSLRIPLGCFLHGYEWDDLACLVEQILFLTTSAAFGRAGRIARQELWGLHRLRPQTRGTTRKAEKRLRSKILSNA